ncbi:hypothetical protein [Spirosoma montaniterrae]|uniref:Uncharacterized protein n=1 Tax=Spirosoma montaniterrae TaxID=1178516 RepID=A0A1P9WZ13_9BACT|nr:hypothetical protein [Spirosoma montaniterrae]AQG80603.1 hypothetical protein AWR27_15500 [Spirosoma montaniterrae]
MTTSSATHSAELPVLTCRAQHRAWADTLSRNEQEIDQLLDLLTTLPEADYRTLTRSLPDYAQALNRLKNSIGQLRTDMVCDGTGCSVPTPVLTCTDTRFVSIAATDAPVSAMAAEFGRLRDNCYALLTRLVGLNLI